MNMFKMKKHKGILFVEIFTNVKRFYWDLHQVTKWNVLFSNLDV